MVIEAGNLPGWAGGKVLNRLKQQPGVVKQLTQFQAAVDAVLQSKIHVLTVPTPLLSTAATISRRHGLLTTDALILALLQANGLTHIATMTPTSTDCQELRGIPPSNRLVRHVDRAPG